MTLKSNNKFLLLIVVLFLTSLLLFVISSLYQIHAWGDTSNLFGNFYEIKNNKTIYTDVFVHRGPIYFVFLAFINFFIELKIHNIIYYIFIHLFFFTLSIIYFLSSIKIDLVKQFLVISIFLIFLITVGIDAMSFQIFHSGLMLIFITSLFNIINNNNKNLNIIIMSVIMPLIFFSRIDGVIYFIFIFLLRLNNIFKIVILTALVSVSMFYLLSSHYNFDMQNLMINSYHYNMEYRGPGPFNILYPKTQWITKLFIISLIFNFIIFYKNKKINYFQTIILNTHMIIAVVTFFLLSIINLIKYLIKEIYYTTKNQALFDGLSGEQIIFLKDGVVYLQYLLVIIFLIISWKIYNIFNQKYKLSVKLIFTEIKIMIKDKIEIVLILIFLLEIAKFTINNISFPSNFLLVVILPFAYLMKNNLGIKNLLFYKKLNLFVLILVLGFTAIKYQKVYNLDTNITENYKNKISNFVNFVREEKIDYILGTDAHFYKISSIKDKNIIYFDQHLLRYDLDLTKFKTAKLYSDKLKEISKINSKIMMPCFYLEFDQINTRFINKNFTKIKEFDFSNFTYCVLESFAK
jgi:hypothetical protein